MNGANKGKRDIMCLLISGTEKDTVSWPTAHPGDQLQNTRHMLSEGYSTTSRDVPFRNVSVLKDKGEPRGHESKMQPAIPGWDPGEENTAVQGHNWTGVNLEYGL